MNVSRGTTTETLKKCSRCGASHRRKNYFCKKCHAAYMREWRSFNPMNAEQKKRENCRSYANVYQRRGLLIPKPCEICGEKKTEKRHPDFSKPLVVKWFCKPCRLKLDLRKRRGIE